MSFLTNLASAVSAAIGGTSVTQEYVDARYPQRHETFLAPATGASNVHAQFTDDADVNSGFTSPGHARNLQVVFGANWPATVHIYAEGKGADGATLKEVIQATQGATVVGVEAFRLLTRVFTTTGTVASTATPTTDSVTAGAGVTADLQLAAAASTVFGVVRKDSALVFDAVSADGVNEAIAASSATRGTFRPTTAPNGTHNYEVQYH